MPINGTELYARLGVPRTAGKRELKRAFREPAKKHHRHVSLGDPAFLPLKRA